MAAPADVLDSPDILDSFFRANRFPADFARASRVCRGWRNAARANPLSAPMLMLPPTAEVFMAQYTRIPGACWLWAPTDDPPLTPPSASSPTFRRVFGGGADFLPEEDNHYPSGALFRGSFPGGWLALELERFGGYCLLNIFSGERINLPNLIRAPDAAVDCAVGIKSMVFSSAPPSSNGSFVVAAISSGVSNVAFWRPGTARWWPPTPQGVTHWRSTLPLDPVIDVMHPNGQFYVLHDLEDLTVFRKDDHAPHLENSSSDGGLGEPLVMKNVRYQFGSSADRPNGDVVGRFLVESRGSIFMIRHIGSPNSFDFFALIEEGVMDSGLVRARWRRCTDELGGRAIFLGMGCSSSMELGIAGKVLVHCMYNGDGWFYM